MKPSETKQCTGCKQFLPLDNFYKWRWSADRLSYKCNKCNKAEKSKALQNRIATNNYVSVETKICNRCKIENKVEFFTKCRASSDGYRSLCKVCTNETQKQYRLKRPGLKYKISDAEYKSLLKKQKSLCAVCKSNEKLYIDHCHKTNKVRGLLCHHCNAALGFLKDSVDSLRRASKYLSEFNKNQN